MNVMRRVIDYLPIMFDVFRWRLDPNNLQLMVRVTDSFPTPDLSLIDCRAEPDPRQAAERLLTQRSNASFGNNKLIDFTLLRVYDTEHRLVIRAHPLLLDDAGFDRLVRYIAEAYSSLVTGGELPSPAPRYAEEVVSARLYQNSLDFAEGRAHWQKQFTEPPGLLLTRPYSLTTNQAYKLAGSNTFCRVLEEASAVVAEPPVYLLLAALTVHFARVTKQSVCVFGRSVAGRQTKLQAGIVGRFDRALPIRLSYQPDQSVRLLARAIRRQHRSDNSHRYFPMSHLARLLGKKDNPQPPLYDVFVKQLPPAPAPMVGDLLCRVERLLSSESHAPLQLLWHEGNAYQPAGLQVLAQSAYITETELRSLLEQVEYLLTEFARRPDAALGSFDTLGKPMRAAIPVAYIPSRLPTQILRLAGV